MKMSAEKVMKNGLNVKGCFLLAGAYISYCIGSGFTTGQDALQYFAGFGAWGFAALVLGLCIHGYTATSFLKLGLERNFQSNLEVYEYYAGPVLGKGLLAFLVVFTFFSATVMVAGFGASLKQNFGISPIFGNAFLAVLCIITVILGLKRVVDIIGTFAPILIVVALITAIYFITQNHEGFWQGMAAAPKIDTPKLGMTWVDSGINFASWAPLITAPFLASAAPKFIKSKREAEISAISGVALYGIAIAVMVAAFFCDYEAISSQEVPTLAMAGLISKLFGMCYIAMMCMGIYTSAVPEFLMFCTSFHKDGTKGFKIFSTVAIILSTILTTLLPFGTIYNYVYLVAGYLGWILIAVVVWKNIKNKR